MFRNPSLTGFRMVANNRTVWARKPQATGLKGKSLYLRMELLVVNFQNSQGMYRGDLVSTLTRIVFIRIVSKIKSLHFRTYGITLVKMI